MRLQLSDPVKAAIASGKPVVALETTLIAHGIPKPGNLKLAHQLEADVRDAGATPATIAIMDGVVKIGLQADALSRLASADDVEKVSTGAMAAAIARRTIGATTVASTAYLAALAGIRFFATGGIGGVHRGGESTLDISADLLELRRSKLVVVAAGAKIILDLARTMEVIESFGITVAGMGTDRLPGFYVERTDIPITKIHDEGRMADLIMAQHALGWPSSILVCNPPPREMAFSRSTLESWLEQAQSACREAGVKGKDETPFLLKQLAKLSGNRTVALNEELVRSNARLAARLAVMVTRNQHIAL